MEGKVRQARLSDLKEMLDLLYQLSPAEGKELSDENLKKTLSKIIHDKNYYVAVYEHNKKIIGTATLLIQLNLSHSARPYGHIENVVTDSVYRGKGIGKQLIIYLITQAKKRNCYKIILNCSEDNVTFYEKCAFNKTGEIEMRINI